MKRLLAKEGDVEIVAECADGAATIDAVRQDSPDLLFLDIQMPGMDGFDILDHIASIGQPAIVFVTAFDKHAVHAFETCALDYLLKPVAPVRLTKTLERVRNYLSTAKPATALPTAPPDATAPTRRFSVRSGQRTTFVASEAIDWIEADGNYAVLHVGTQNHFLRETMSTLESELPAKEFLRVSRSAIVHLNRVKEIQTAADNHHCAVLVDGQRVPVTRSVRQIGARLRALC